MSDRVPPIPPISGPERVRRGTRMLVLRKRLENYAQGGSEPQDTAEALAPEPASIAGVAAQLLGERPRRGLKGGQQMLEQARSSYLQNEYSGTRDRRPAKGRITRTEV